MEEREKFGMSNQNENDVSWIVALIKLALYMCLWPVGIFLLIRKIRRDRKALMKAYRGIDEMRAASVEELAAVDGMTKSAADNLYQYLHRELTSDGNPVK